MPENDLALRHPQRALSPASIWSVHGRDATGRFHVAAEAAVAIIAQRLGQPPFDNGTANEIINFARMPDSDDLRFADRKLRPYSDIVVPSAVLAEAVRRVSADPAARAEIADALCKCSSGGNVAFVAAAQMQLEAGNPSAAIIAAKSALGIESACPIAQQILFDAYVARDGKGVKNPDVFTGELTRKFCSLPFDYLAVVDFPVPGSKVISARGFACACGGWLPYPIADLLEVSDWNAMWNGEAAQEIRRSILDGDYTYCSRTLCPYIVQDSLPELDAVTEPHLRQAIDNRELVRPEAPRRAQLSHDQSCNLACPSCRIDIIVAKSPQRAIFDDMAQRILLPMMAQMKGTVTITGMGDPFGSKHYRWIVSQMDAERFPGVSLDFVTNAQLLTRSEWKRLGPVQTLVKSISVSVDAASAETYEDVRRPGKWDILLENLDLIAELRRDGKIGFFQLCFVVQRKNFREMPDFVRLGKRLGVDSIIFQKLWNIGSFSGAQFDEADLLSPYHPEHGQLSAVLADPIFADPAVNLFNSGLVAGSPAAPEDTDADDEFIVIEVPDPLLDGPSPIIHQAAALSWIASLRKSISSWAGS